MSGPGPASRGGRIVAAAVAAALLLVGGEAVPSGHVPAASAATPSAVGRCVAGWQTLPVPDKALVSTPYEILSRKGKAAWVLGGSNSGPVVLRWKNGRWRRVATSGGHAGIVGASLVGGNVLAAGYARTNGDTLTPATYRVRKRGAARRRVPDPPGPAAALADVALRPNGTAWAVGTRNAVGRSRAYAVLWNGKRWIRQDPRGGGASSGLTGIARAPNHVIWAVGWREPSLGNARPFILRRRDGGWRKVSAPKLPAGEAALTDIDFGPTGEGWAVGYLRQRGTSKFRVFLFHHDGSGWSRADLPWASDFVGIPRAIAAGGGGRVWIAGTQLAKDEREPRGFIASFDDGSWDVARLDVPNKTRSEVLAVAATSTGAIASGTVVNSALLLRTCSGGSSAGGGIAVGALAAREATASIDPHAGEPDDHETEGGLGIATATANSGSSSTPALRAPSRFRVRDIAARHGLDFRMSTWGGFATDMDGDGRKDLFIGRHKNKLPLLLLNRDGRFVNGSKAPYRNVDRHACDAADVDRDGARDIFCAAGRGRGRQITRHELSLRAGMQDASLKRNGAGIVDPFGRGRRVTFIKLDDDPWPELFITNRPDRDDSQRSRNRFYRNVGGSYVPAPGVGLDRAVGGRCVHAGDIDKDGDADLLLCVEQPDDRHKAGLRVFRNENGRLRDRTAGLGVKPMNDLAVELRDVTGDGRRDLIQLSRSRLRVSRGTKSGFTRIAQIRTSDAVALALGDASGDGRPDIYVVRSGKGNKPDRLLVNKDAGRRWVSVRIPQASGGKADDVIAFDHDDNGHTDFVVLNGSNTFGPVQFLASYPD